ncbi:SDR family oxidoreductase [Jonesia quinghaiensis]|uniref:SDR family oxidoreductase n=1 Tax=Jonesia quinghaiensis TaxID=262806 RepID=UPI0003FCB449|nr:SDR family oxidoreductase [Jonesia quinghaiensis]
MNQPANAPNDAEAHDDLTTPNDDPVHPPVDLTAPTGEEPELRAQPHEDGTPPRVLVLGATGYLGGRLVPRLLNAGYLVRVLARTPDRIQTFTWGAHPNLDVMEGDASDTHAMNMATRDVDVIYHLVHSMSGGTDFAQRDRAIAHVLGRSAAAAGVSRIVYLGGLHPDAHDLSRHLASRQEVGDILLASHVPTVVLQAGVVIGSGSASFEMVRHLTEVLPVMPAPRWVLNRIQPIAVRDVLYYLLGAARIPGTVNRAYDIGGPDVLRYSEMMNGYAAEAGLPRRRIAALPVLTPRLASHWVNLVTPVPRQIARPLVESLQHDCVMQNHDIDEVIPLPAEGLMPYRESVQFALGRMDLDQVETSWRDANIAQAPSDPLPSDPEWAGRTAYTDERVKDSSAPVDALWRVVIGIGGENGWYSTPVLWAIRGWIDKLVGGVGLARGRRSSSTVGVGDAIDFWRVEALDEGRLLRLRAEMKVPGYAWLEMRCEPHGDGSRYSQRAVFFPRGLSGRLYWWAVYPFHGLVFSGMQNRIVALAEQRDEV